MSLTLQIRKGAIGLPAVLVIVVAYVLITIAALNEYISFLSPTFIMGMAGIATALRGYRSGKTSVRYGLFATVAGVACFLLPVKTLLYLTISFALVFLREQRYGRTGPLVPVIIGLVSPVFQYVADICSFPIRLALTSICGQILQIAAADVSVAGNMITLNGQEFSVDPACMGLKMITVSLLLGCLVLANMQIRSGKLISWYGLALFLAIVFLSNVIANIFRIVLLVLLKLMPASLMHDMIGIVCLLVYTFIPTLILAPHFIRWFGGVPPGANGSRGSHLPFKKLTPHLIFIGFVIFLSCKVAHADTYSKVIPSMPANVNGYQVSVATPGVFQLRSVQSLIYLKYVRGFYDTEHNPMLCWTGSGYQFEQIQREKLCNVPVFAGRLIKGGEILYTAWWYENGQVRTDSQWRWRTDLLKGGTRYAIVNVTCASRNELEAEIRKIVNQKTLSSFFTP